MRGRFYLAALLAALAILGVACSPPPAKQTPAVTVIARTVERHTVESRVTLPGTVEPERTSRLVAQVEGEVELLAVREGDPVRSGAVLLRIDPTRLEAARAESASEILAVQADLEDATRVLERDRILFERQGIGKERLEKSETAVERLAAAAARARAREAGLAAQLADTQVRAPFDGYVLERSVELGDVVKSGSPLLSIASRESLVLVQVSEIDLAGIQTGDDVQLTAGGPDGAAPGKVARIRPQIDPVTRTAAVEVRPAAGGPRLLPGMLVQATFVLARRDQVIAVPAEAVLVRPDGSRALFTVAGEVAALRQVSTGLEGGGWLEVVEGIQEGDLVVVQGQERLKDGAPVKVKGVGGGR